MSRQDKVLEIMSLARLPLHAKIARLARKWIGKPFDRAQAKAVVKCYLEDEGRVPVLTQRLMDEKVRQERVRNERKALADARKVWERSPMDKYRLSPDLKRHRTMEVCQRTFGQAVKDNFNEDALAMMSLISGEERSYRIWWIDASFRPVRCALIEVITHSRVNPCQTNTLHTRWLLYKVAGRVLVLRTGRGASTCIDAWSRAVPEKLVKVADELRASGCRIESDLETQEMIVYDPDGNEAKRVEWEGRTVDG